MVDNPAPVETCSAELDACDLNREQHELAERVVIAVMAVIVVMMMMMMMIRWSITPLRWKHAAPSLTLAT